jgi:Fe-S cluster assembly iron-binding protein IscA
MFTLTEPAAEAINHLTTAQNVRQQGGLRMTLDALSQGGAALLVEVAPYPEPGDDVIDAAGTQVFLARATRARLTDKILDVRKDVDGHFTFLVKSHR